MASPLPGYKPSGFTKKDYRKLYHRASSSALKNAIIRAKYRDKRIQREDSQIRKVLLCPLEDLPLHLNHNSSAVHDIARWRLEIRR